MDDKVIGLLEINKIHLLDVFEGMKQLPDDCVDLIITDPLYNIGDSNKITKVIVYLSLWRFQMQHCLKCGAKLRILPIYVCICGSVYVMNK